MTNRKDGSEAPRIKHSDRDMEFNKVIEEMKRQGRELDKNQEQNSLNDEEKNENVANKIILGKDNHNYIIGIIDILQNWNRKKKMASYFKKCMYFCCNIDIDIDTEPPNIYRKRFIYYLISSIIR